MQTKYLSEKERRVGRHHFALHEFWNGISIGFLGDTLIYVLAVHFNAGNLSLGYISSALYIAALVLPLVMPLLRGKNIKSIFWICWLLRGLLCIGHLGLLFLDGKAAVVLLLVVFSLYAIFRAIAIVMYDPLAKSITTIRSRGAFYARVNIYYNALTLVAKVFAVFAIEYSPLASVLTIVILQMIGIVGNTFASIEVSKVPCRITFESTNDYSFLKVVKSALSNKKTASRVWLRWLQLTILVMMGMTVPFMSKKLGLGDSIVVLYTVDMMGAYIIAGMVSEALSDRIGSKPLAILGSMLFILTGLCWAFFPLSFGPIPFFLIGFFSNFSIQLVYLLSCKLTADVIPEKGSVSFTVMITLGAAILSLIGGLLSGALVNLGDSGVLSFIPYATNDYSLCFIVSVFLGVVVLVISLFMKEEGAQSSKMLFSRRGLRAVSTLSRLESIADPLQRRRLVIDLSENTAIIAKEEVRAKLRSPFSRDARDIIKTLGLKPSLIFEKDLIELASNDDSYVQTDAISALSSYKTEKTREALIRIMRDSKWSSARALAAYSLSYFDGTSEFLEGIRKDIASSKHVDVVMNYMTSEYNMDKEKKLFERIFESVKNKRSKSFRATIYAYLDTLLSDETPRLARIYEHISLGTPVHEAIYTFLEDLRDVESIDSSIDALTQAYKDKDIEKEKMLSLELINSASDTGIPENILPSWTSLKKGLLSIEDIDNEELDMTDMVALVYFSALLVSPGTFVFPYSQSKKVLKKKA